MLTAAAAAVVMGSVWQQLDLLNPAAMDTQATMSGSSSSSRQARLPACQCRLTEKSAAAALQVTISNVSGDTLKTVEFKGDPVQLCAATCKNERPSSAKGKVSPH